MLCTKIDLTYKHCYTRLKNEVGVFKQGDVLKQMFHKGYKISFRMYLNLCNAELMWKIKFMGK